MAVDTVKVKNIGGNSLPQRRVIVSLEKFGTNPKELWINKDENNLDIKISLKRNYGGIDPRASISILNLSPENISLYTTEYFNPEYPTKVRVYVGYETQGQEESEIPFLFQGDVIWATPTTGRPDIWFTMQVVEDFFDINEPLTIYSNEASENSLSICYKNVNSTSYLDSNSVQEYEYTENSTLKRVNVFDIIKSVFKATPYANVRLDYFEKLYIYSPDRYTKYNIYESNYRFDGTLGSFINAEPFKINKMSASIINGEVWLLPNTEDMGFISSTEDERFLPSVSAASNPPMIDIPKPNATGVDFKMLYNTNIIPPVCFKLESQLFICFNRVYWVQQVHYDLHLRGKNFYINVIARRA